jgi:guanylate kinase
MSKFLLLLGPSGVGKTAIIEELYRLDSRFVYISPYMTRRLRKGEKNKISISDNQMDKLQNRGKFLVVNSLYGIRYGTPISPIIKALTENKFPVLDWPISKIKVVTQAFPDQLYIVYISPPSIEILCDRLAKDKRDTDGQRLKNAREELAIYWSSGYFGIYDFEITSEENQIPKITRAIYTNYLKSFCS